jgi:hypothetical protein
MSTPVCVTDTHTQTQTHTHTHTERERERECVPTYINLNFNRKQIYSSRIEGKSASNMRDYSQSEVLKKQRTKTETKKQKKKFYSTKKHCIFHLSNYVKVLKKNHSNIIGYMFCPSAAVTTPIEAPYIFGCIL